MYIYICTHIFPFWDDFTTALILFKGAKSDQSFPTCDWIFSIFRRHRPAAGVQMDKLHSASWNLKTWVKMSGVKMESRKGYTITKQARDCSNQRITY